MLLLPQAPDMAVPSVRLRDTLRAMVPGMISLHPTFKLTIPGYDELPYDSRSKHPHG